MKLKWKEHAEVKSSLFYFFIERHHDRVFRLDAKRFSKYGEIIGTAQYYGSKTEMKAKASELAKEWEKNPACCFGHTNSHTNPRNRQE